MHCMCWICMYFWRVLWQINLSSIHFIVYRLCYFYENEKLLGSNKKGMMICIFWLVFWKSTWHSDCIAISSSIHRNRGIEANMLLGFISLQNCHKAKEHVIINSYMYKPVHPAILCLLTKYYIPCYQHYVALYHHPSHNNLHLPL